MPDRSWEQGLHQMIEVKEGSRSPAQRETLARISYQRFFRRYLRLAGMTGTGARGGAARCGRSTGCAVVAHPDQPPVRARARCPTACYRDRDEKWQRGRRRASPSCTPTGQPVLVGTRSVAASERCAARC